MADKKKTSELTANSSPSTSATLVGVDNGETVQIPITEFVTKDENENIGEVVAKKITLSDTSNNDDGSIKIEDDRVSIMGANSIHLMGGHGGDIILYEPDETIYISGGRAVKINSTCSDNTKIYVEDDGQDKGLVEIRGRKNISMRSDGALHIGIGDSYGSAINFYDDDSGIEIDTNNLALGNVSQIVASTSKDSNYVSSGEPGQVLTSNGDGDLYWGNIPSLDGYAKTTDLFSKDYNDLTNKPDIPSIDGLASTSYVDTKVAGIVNSAPAALDTLNELSKALGNDANFSATVATQIGNKVDKENGKGLSTNDYTTAEKNKLAGIAEGANKYIHPDTHPASMITGLSKVATSGSYNDLTDKPTIPSGGGSGGGASFIECETLPTENYDTNVIYATTVEKIELVQGGAIDENSTVEIVDELPEVGVEFVNVTTYATYIYYLRSDARMYVYLNDELASMFSASVGWNDTGALGLAGYITSLDEAVDPNVTYFLFTKPKLYRFTTSGQKIEILTHNSFIYDPYNETFTLVED